MTTQLASSLPYLIPIVFMGLMIARSMRGRRLRVERLWVMPAMMAAFTGYAIAEEPPIGPYALAGFIAAAIVGGLIGWQRGKLTRIEIDPQTHEFTSRASSAGALLLVAVFVGRYTLRMLIENGAFATALHMNAARSAARMTDGLLLFVVGVMAAQRLEMWIRAEKLLIAERTKPSSPPAQ